jgi:hypothetical protein
MRRSSRADREGPALSSASGRVRRDPNSVMRSPFIADDGQTGGNAETELTLWEV